MATTLTIDVKSNAAQGFGQIRSDVDKTTGAVDRLAQSADAAADAMPTKEADALADAVRALTQELQRSNDEGEKQVRVVNEQRSSWSHLASTAVPAITTITTASLNYATVLAQLAAKQKYLETIMSPLPGSQRAFNSMVQAGEKAALRGAASLAGYGAAASSLLTIVGGVTIGVKSLEAVLSVTGAKTNQFGEIETNLDRARVAAEGLTDDIAALGSEGASALKTLAAETANWAYETSGLKAGWTEFDRQITERTDNWVTNARALGSAIRGVSRDAVDASAAIKAAQDASADDFERVRSTNKLVEDSDKSRAEAARIASIATINGIDGELRALKQRRAESAAAGTFDEQAAQKYIADIDRIESRRASILDKRRQEDAAERARQIAADKQASEENFRQYNEGIDARNRAILKQNADNEKALDEQVRAIMDKSREEQRLAEQVTAAHRKEFERRRDEYISSWKAAVDSTAALIKGEKGGGPNIVDDMRSKLDPRAIAKQVGDQRAAQAESEFRSSGEGKRREDALVASGVDRFDAERRVMAQQRALAKDARASGFRDSMQGKASDQEKLTAERDLIGNQIRQAAEQGGLNDQLLQGFIQAANESFKNSQEIASQRQQLQALMTQFGASSQRVRAQRGSQGF